MAIAMKGAKVIPLDIISAQMLRFSQPREHGEEEFLKNNAYHIVSS